MGWAEKKVLITGIGGFKGSRLARALVDAGADVTGLVNNVNSVPIPVLEDCNIVFGDVCDYETMCETISHYEIDTIYHFAASSIVRISSRDPMTTYRINIMGTVSMLEAARNVGKTTRIVVASSDKAYGDHVSLPYTELHSLQPQNTYDTSKACMDMIARSYAKNYDMEIVVTRCSNVYGPGDMSLSRIVPRSIKKCLEGEAPVLYEGVQDMERELIYIDDVVDAYMKIGAHPSKIGGEAFNIGGTGVVKMYDLVKKISKLTGYEGEPRFIYKPNEFKEIKKQYIDASKLEKVVGWKHETSLDDGLSETVEWYRDFYERGMYR